MGQGNINVKFIFCIRRKHGLCKKLPTDSGRSQSAVEPNFDYLKRRLRRLPRSPIESTPKRIAFAAVEIWVSLRRLRRPRPGVATIPAAEVNCINCRKTINYKSILCKEWTNKENERNQNTCWTTVERDPMLPRASVDEEPQLLLVSISGS